jgi:hypothetical protein
LIPSKPHAAALIPSRCAAIEMIPVAMTRAKYPGNRSAAAMPMLPGYLVVSFTALLKIEDATQDCKSAEC